MRLIRMILALLIIAPSLALAQSYPNPYFKSTNSTTPRSAADRFADVYNVLDNGLKGDCATDNHAALVSLMNRANASSPANSRARIFWPVPPGGCYAINSATEIPSNIDLDPAGGVIIQNQSAASPTGTGAIFTITNETNVRIGAFTLDQQKSIHTAISQAVAVNGSSGIILDHVKVINPSGSLLVQTSHDVHILWPDIQGSLYHGVYFNGVYDSEVLNGTFQNEVGFGIILAGVNYRNLLSGNHTTSNGIELIGVTSGSYQNIITNNHAEGTGDNCISITGHENTVSNNEAIGCAGNGIHIYGDRNTVTGNYAKNNSQQYATNTSWRAGIAVEQGFGGMGQYNVVTGNITDDDQASPTQQYGVWIAPSAYVAWAGSHAYASGSYVFNGLNLYMSTNAATSGASAPTCTSGTCSDGAVTWQFVSTFAAGNVLNDHNAIEGNNNVHSAIQSYLDASGASNNEALGGYNPLPIPTNLSASSIGNAGSVSAISPVSKGSYSNGTNVSLTVAISPTGNQATATPVFAILGFGTIATGGSGCSVNDILTLQGGTFSAAGDKIKVLSVDGNGAVLTFTGNTFDNYTALPPAGNTSLTGGTCTSEPTLTGTVWQINSVNVTSGGGGYTIAPTVSASSGSPTFTVTLTSSFTISGGAGTVTLNGTGVNITGPLSQSGGTVSLTGTATNDNAGSGIVGQIVTSSVPVGSAPSLTTGGTSNITSISLTAGDWDVTGAISFHPGATTSVTLSSGGINTTSATMPLLSTGASATQATAAQVPASDYGLALPVTRISVASTTTVYLVASSTFTVSTQAAYGFIRARRVR